MVYRGFSPNTSGPVSGLVKAENSREYLGGSQKDPSAAGKITYAQG
jgi:hypothetical protein